MFCPQCGAEYREGYSSCSDCHVLLVRERQRAERHDASPEPGDPNKDPFCGFWKGDDPRVHAELCEVLEQAGIPHRTVYRKDHLFNLANYPTFQIGVPASRFEDSEKAVRDAFGSDVEDNLLDEPTVAQQPIPNRENLIRKLPAMLSQSEHVPGPTGPGDLLEWDPEDATTSVWSGDDEYVAIAIIAALNENDLHSRRTTREEHTEVFVLPAEARRAREIVREIVEGAIPE